MNKQSYVNRSNSGKVHAMVKNTDLAIPNNRPTFVHVIEKISFFAVHSRCHDCIGYVYGGLCVSSFCSFSENHSRRFDWIGYGENHQKVAVHHEGK